MYGQPESQIPELKHPGKQYIQSRYRGSAMRPWCLLKVSKEKYFQRKLQRFGQVTGGQLKGVNEKSIQNAST